MDAGLPRSCRCLPRTNNDRFKVCPFSHRNKVRIGIYYASVYAVTRMNKSFGALFLLICTQFGFGVYFVAGSVRHPSRFLKHLVSCEWAHAAYTGSLAANRYRPVQDLHVLTLKACGVWLHQSRDCFRCGTNLDRTFPCATHIAAS